MRWRQQARLLEQYQICFMQLHDAIALIQNKYIHKKTTQHWAELGCGSGLFTHALATQLAAGSIIHAIDKNISAFKKFASPVTIKREQLDFVKDALDLHDLDGVLMANALHFVQNKINFLARLRPLIKQNGHILIVEYDTDIANPWVPYPISFLSSRQLFIDTGYAAVIKLHEMPSKYNRAHIYAAIIEAQ
jgi:2-polyprenyl-3-methyl-5-hydroxy-6-metoxy-1,4-benzoquinol methylase